MSIQHRLSTCIGAMTICLACPHLWKDWLKCVESWYDTAGFDDPPHHYVVADEDVLVAYQKL